MSAAAPPAHAPAVPPPASNATGLDLLLLPLDFPAAVETVHLLEPVQLAIVALRPDCDVLTRQRAYSVWVQKKLGHEEGSAGTDDLFRVDVTLLTMDIERMSPAELLVAQFSPYASSVAIEAATKRFMVMAEAAKLAFRLPEGEVLHVEMGVQRVLVEGDTGPVTQDQDLMFRVSSEAVIVTHADREEVCRMEKGDIARLTYIAGRQDTSDPLLPTQECSLRVVSRSRSTVHERPSVTLVVHLGYLHSKAPNFFMLRKVFRLWAKSLDFLLDAEEAPVVRSEPVIKDEDSDISSDLLHPSERHISPPSPQTSSKRPRAASERDDRPAAEASTSAAVHDGRRERTRRESWTDTRDDGRGTEQHNRPRASMSSTVRMSPQYPGPSVMWRLVSHRLIETAWNPGYFIRQAALLLAFDPTAQLHLPFFKAFELVLLAFQTNHDALPEPMRAREASQRFSTAVRIAAERVYKGKTFIDTDQTRWLVSDAGDPSTKAYIELVSKVVTCRDVFRDAWGTLRDLMVRGLRPHDTGETLRVVEALAAGDAFRLETFTDRGVLTARNKFKLAELGPAVHRRYSEALASAVRFEAEAWSEFAPRDRG